MHSHGHPTCKGGVVRAPPRCSLGIDTDMRGVREKWGGESNSPVTNKEFAKEGLRKGTPDRVVYRAQGPSYWAAGRTCL
eukprot:458478-Pyramimonas_sp.AAC.1